MEDVALPVPAELGFPVPEVALRALEPQLAGVLVPEAPVDEHDHAVPGEHDVGDPGEVATVAREPEPEPVQRGADRTAFSGFVSVLRMLRMIPGSGTVRVVR